MEKNHKATVYAQKRLRKTLSLLCQADPQHRNSTDKNNKKKQKYYF